MHPVSTMFGIHTSLCFDYKRHQLCLTKNKVLALFSNDCLSINAECCLYLPPILSLACRPPPLALACRRHLPPLPTTADAIIHHSLLLLSLFCGRYPCNFLPAAAATAVSCLPAADSHAISRSPSPHLLLPPLQQGPLLSPLSPHVRRCHQLLPEMVTTSACLPH